VKADSSGSNVSRSYPKPALAAKTVSAGLFNSSLVNRVPDQLRTHLNVLQVKLKWVVRDSNPRPGD